MRHLSFLRVTGILLCLFTASPGRADVKMPGLFVSNMMLQRAVANPVWGWADPGEEVEISIQNQSIIVVADEKGRWKVALKPLEAGGPFEMTIKGKNTIQLKNILVGDIWVCSGQSNMEWPVAAAENAKQEIANGFHPKIRILTVPKKVSLEPEEEMVGEWKICNPSTVADFSAVGFFFGRLLQDSLQVPIGLIDASWGGSLIETWISEAQLREVDGMEARIQANKIKNSPQRRATIKERIENIAGPIPNDGDPGLKEHWEDPQHDFSGWKSIEIPQKWDDAGLEDLNGVVWLKKEFTLSQVQANNKEAILNLGPIDDSDITWINGVKAGETKSKWDRPREYKIPAGVLKPGRNVLVVRVEDDAGNGGFWGTPEQLCLITAAGKVSLDGIWKIQVGDIDLGMKPNQNPTSLFNGMINPLIPFAIKGAIWYQGESNGGQGYKYRTLMPMMMEDWRGRWGQDDFPFLMVQLPNYGKVEKEPGKSQWAELREAQLLTTLNHPNTGMAVTLDIGEGDNIHPRNKQDVGKRLGLYALGMVYKKDIVYSGPIYKSYKIEGDRIKIFFDHPANGLRAKDGDLKGFSIAGTDGIYKWAKAQIEGNAVVVHNPEIKNPKNVRYAWADNPEDANLYNSAGLPASPFRTDVRE